MPLKFQKIDHQAIAQYQTLITSLVPAGFPSPAADYEEVPLDLNRHLIKHPAATFFVRAQGDSMQGAGIYNGDLLIVDKSIKPQSGMVIIALIDNEFTVKRFMQRGAKVTLSPENKDYNDIIIQPGMDFEVWGVVIQVVHNPN